MPEWVLLVIGAGGFLVVAIGLRLWMNREEKNSSGEGGWTWFLEGGGMPRRRSRGSEESKGEPPGTK